MTKLSSTQSPLLPKEDAREAALFFVVSALCFLAALAGFTSRSAYAAAENWTNQVTGQVTIRIHGNADEANEALDLLAQVPGIRTSHLITNEEAEELLKPWIGAARIPDSLPIPRLIAVETLPGHPSIVDQTQAIFQANQISAKIDDHVDWSQGVRRATNTAGFAALIALALLGATACAVIAFATHATLLARKDIVELLHLSGAKDKYIASLFEQRFLMLGVKAGTMGALSAFGATAFILFMVKQSEDQLWLLPQLSLSLSDGMIVGLTPLMAGLAAMLAAKITVMNALKELF